MARISTAAAADAALLNILSAQQVAFEAQTQVATGRVAEDLAGFGATATEVTDTRALTARTESFIEAAQSVAAQTSIQDLSLNSLSEQALALRDSLTSAVSLDEGSFLLDDLSNQFSIVVGALNVTQAGQFLFGGTRTDQIPVNVTSLGDLASRPTIEEIFDNGPQARVARIDENQVVEVAPLADEAGLLLLDSIRRIAQFDAGPDGPFDGEITPAQRTFLETEIQNVTAAFEEINLIQSRNGLIGGQADDAALRLEDQQFFLLGLSGDLENADLAEAAILLNLGQTAVAASAQAFSALSDSTLLNFI
ncbi:MAG: hypothetical protein ACFB2Z_15160 [Maricaulaceae bacterium]